MKFDVYERVRNPLHGRHKVGGVREGFAQFVSVSAFIVFSSDALLPTMSAGASVTIS
jgi:hypothetical protein